MGDVNEWEPRHRRVGLVGRIGCLPLLAAVLVIAVVGVIASKMLESSTLGRQAPEEWALPGDPVLTPGEPVTGGPTQTASVTSPRPSPKPSQTVVRYEAEEAFVWLGKVQSDHTGFTGAGFVNYNNTSGSFVQWTFQAARAGSVTIRLRYANGTQGNRSMDILVNGKVTAAGARFDPTGQWTNWQIKTINITLNAGPNIIRAVAANTEGGPNVDYLEIRY